MRYGATSVVALGVIVSGSIVASATKTLRNSGAGLVNLGGLTGDVITMNATGISGAGSTGGTGDIAVAAFNWDVKGSSGAPAPAAAQEDQRSILLLVGAGSISGVPRSSNIARTGGP